MRLMQGDCLECMNEIKDGSVDLVVTSPPYDNLREYSGGFKGWDSRIWKPCLDHIKRVLKEGGVCVWIVNDATINGSETGTSFRQALYAMEIGLNLHDTMIWEKESFKFPDPYRYQGVFEFMFIFSKGQPKTINIIMDKKNKMAGQIMTGTERRVRRGGLHKISGEGRPVKDFGRRHNVWKQNTDRSEYRRKHPAVFPLNLAHDHVISWSNEGDIVLDPFMGSGTTGEACKQTGREFIGIEQDPTYFKLAEERIKAAVQQYELF